MNADQTFIVLLESAINRLLRLDPATLARVAELQGKVIRLRAAGDRPLEIFVLPDESGLQLRSQHDREPDVTLTGDIPVIFRFVLRRFVPDVVAAGEVQISGDINLGQRFQRLLEQADIDWEEQASRVLGDVPAHQLGNALRDLGGWSQQTLHTLKQDLGEYLQEESRLLPVRSRAGAFRRSVETLERDLESLEKRLTRLRETAK
ncbi:MAG: SCP2 domain-containing protein [Sulfuricaulis sp.]